MAKKAQNAQKIGNLYYIYNSVALYLHYSIDDFSGLIPDELNERFLKQIDTTEKARKSGDKLRIKNAEVALNRACLKVDLALRADGHKPKNECVYVVCHSNTNEKICIYDNSASIEQLPKNMIKFSIEELAQFIPVEVLQTKKLFKESKVKSVRPKDEPFFDDEIPF